MPNVSSIILPRRSVHPPLIHRRVKVAETSPKRKKITIRELQRKMREKEQIVQLAVYDYRNAVIADRLGVDILCVSDTGGMVLFGR